MYKFNIILNNISHNYSIIDSTAKVGKKCSNCPFCKVGERVKLGDGCKLHSHINIQGDVEIGANTEIFPFVSIGSIPQDLKHKGEKN